VTVRHKDFSSGTKVKTPLTFNIDEEEFTARPAVPGALLLDFVAEADSEDPVRAADAVMSFFDLALVDEDKDRFRDFIRDPDVAIQMDIIAQVIEWLVEQYTARPTPPPSPSRNTRTRSGRGSTDTTSTVVESL